MNNRILIIQPSRIGDVIFSLPALVNLRKLYPKAHIAWLIDDRCKDLLNDNPYLDEVIVFPFKRLNLFTGIIQILKLRKKLRSMNFDLSIDLHGLFKSAVIVWLANAKQKIGSSNSYGMKELSWLFSKEIKSHLAQTLHTIDRHLEVVKYLAQNMDPKILPYLKKEFPLSCKPVEEEYISALLKSKNIKSNYIILFPGGGWRSRRWFPERFAEIADRLIIQYDVDIIFIGGKPGGSSEHGITKQIISSMKEKAHDLSGQITIMQLIALIKKANMFIGNEAGPMHIACALETPVIAIIGPTNPFRTGPFGNKFILIRKEVNCGPCRNRNCANLKCMKPITVDDVLNGVSKLKFNK